MHIITALIVADPKEASRRILDALRKAKMNQRKAYTTLGVNSGTWASWVEKLQLAPAIQRLRDQAVREGWHHEDNKKSPGRPPGAKDQFPRQRRAANA